MVLKGSLSVLRVSLLHFSSMFTDVQLYICFFIICEVCTIVHGRVSDYERKVVQQLCEKQHVAWK